MSCRVFEKAANLSEFPTHPQVRYISWGFASLEVALFVDVSHDERIERAARFSAHDTVMESYIRALIMCNHDDFHV